MKRRRQLSRTGLGVMAGGIALAVVGGVVIWRGVVRDRACLEEYKLRPYPTMSVPCQGNWVKATGALLAPLGVVGFAVGVGIGLSEES